MSYDFKITNGDWSLGSNADIQRVENTEKVIQDILKIIIFPLGKNVFFPWYGSPVSKTLVGNAFDMEFLSTTASSQLMTALETLQKLQQEQAKRQRVTPFEQIAAVQRVSIERNNVDPRYFSVVVKVATRAMTTAQTELVIKPVM